MKFRATIKVNCTLHPEGHTMRCYSDNTDDAFWLLSPMLQWAEANGLDYSEYREIRDNDGHWHPVTNHPVDEESEPPW